MRNIKSQKYLIQILAGLVAGLAGVTLGIGGGVILVPILIFTNMKPKNTVATSLSLITFISLSGTIQHLYLKTITLSHEYILLIVCGITGAFLGSIALEKSKNKTILYFIITYFYLMGAFMILKPMLTSSANTSLLPESLFWVAGIPVAMLAALTGIGGGALLMPVLLYIFGVPAKMAVGISIPFIFFLSFTATITNFKNKLIDFKVFKLILPTALIGTFIGCMFFHKIQGIHIQIGIGLLLLLNAISMTRKYPSLIGSP